MFVYLFLNEKNCLKLQICFYSHMLCPVFHLLTGDAESMEKFSRRLVSSFFAPVYNIERSLKL